MYIQYNQQVLFNNNEMVKTDCLILTRLKGLKQTVFSTLKGQCREIFQPNFFRFTSSSGLLINVSKVSLFYSVLLLTMQSFKKLYYDNQLFGT